MYVYFTVCFRSKSLNHSNKSHIATSVNTVNKQTTLFAGNTNIAMAANSISSSGGIPIILNIWAFETNKNENGPSNKPKPPSNKIVRNTRIPVSIIKWLQNLPKILRVIFITEIVRCRAGARSRSGRAAYKKSSVTRVEVHLPCHTWIGCRKIIGYADMIRHR